MVPFFVWSLFLPDLVDPTERHKHPWSLTFVTNVAVWTCFSVTMSIAINCRYSKNLLTRDPLRKVDCGVHVRKLDIA